MKSNGRKITTKCKCGTQIRSDVVVNVADYLDITIEASPCQYCISKAVKEALEAKAPEFSSDFKDGKPCPLFTLKSDKTYCKECGKPCGYYRQCPSGDDYEPPPWDWSTCHHYKRYMKNSNPDHERRITNLKDNEQVIIKMAKRIKAIEEIQDEVLQSQNDRLAALEAAVKALQTEPFNLDMYGLCEDCTKQSTHCGGTADINTLTTGNKRVSKVIVCDKFEPCPAEKADKGDNDNRQYEQCPHCIPSIRVPDGVESPGDNCKVTNTSCFYAWAINDWRNCKRAKEAPAPRPTDETCPFASPDTTFVENSVNHRTCAVTGNYCREEKCGGKWGECWHVKDMCPHVQPPWKHGFGKCLHDNEECALNYAETWQDIDGKGTTCPRVLGRVKVEKEGVPT